jgi:hypothetical protein
MDGHFTLEPSGDSNEGKKLLVADGHILLDANKGCQ